MPEQLDKRAGTDDRAARRRGLAWTVSIAVHAALLVAAIFIVPFSGLLEDRSGPRTVPTQQVQDVAEHIREAQAAQVRENLARMLAIEREMAELLEPKLDRYERLEEEMIATAAEDALSAQSEALAAQDQAGALQRKIQEDPIGQAGLHAEVVRLQAEVEAAQQRAERAARLLGERFRPALEAQRAAAAAQAAVSELQLQANEHRTQKIVKPDREIRDEARRLENDGEAVAQRRDKAEALREPMQAAAEKRDEAVAAAEAATRAAESAEAAREAAGEEIERRARERLERAARGARREADRARNAAERAGRDADDRRKRYEAAIADVERREAAIAKRAEELDARRAALDQVLKSPPDLGETERQAEAQRLQTRAKAELEALLASSGSTPQLAQPEGAEADRSEAYVTQVAAEQSAVQQQMEALDLAELYGAVRAMEERVSEHFHEFKSADVALQRRVSIDEARGDVDATTPPRQDFDEALLTGTVRSVEQLEAARAEMSSATLEVMSMRGRAENLLTQMMQDAGPLHAPQGGTTVQLVAEQRDEPIVQRSEERTKSQMKLDQFVIDRGRRVSLDGAPADLLAVTSWYVLGPYPNPQRRNIDQVFPPEQMVANQNLDDVYDNGAGEMLRWRYHEERGPMMTPIDKREYAIYYAYTELHSEIAQEVTFFIGSDDQSKVWLNGEKVYESDDRLTNWYPDRGVVSVQLQPGANRILFRVENGWHGCNWSLIVADPAGPLPRPEAG